VVHKKDSMRGGKKGGGKKKLSNARVRTARRVVGKPTGENFFGVVGGGGWGCGVFSSAIGEDPNRREF